MCNQSLFLICFKLNADLTAVYRKYTSRSILNTCVDFSVIAIPNSQSFTNMFDDVSCAGSNLRNTIYKPLYVSERLKYCLNGTEVHNATTSGAGEIEQYCGKLSCLCLSFCRSLTITFSLFFFLSIYLLNNDKFHEHKCRMKTK